MDAGYQLLKKWHFGEIVTRLARLPRQHRRAVAGLVGLGLAVIGLAWLAASSRRGGSTESTTGCQATLPDSSSWERVRPEWPKNMPVLPPAAGTIIPAVVDCPTSTVPALPSVATSFNPELPVTEKRPSTVPTPSIASGPELIRPACQPVAAAASQAQPWAQNAPPPTMSAWCPAAQRTSWNAPVQAPAPPIDRLPAVRSEAMDKISAQSDQQIRHGFELANRGAYFAARAEFTAALRLIVQGLDNEQNTTAHSRALSAALTAIQEAQDFIPAHGKLEGELDLKPIVACHSTPVLKGAPAEQLQAMRAVKQYHTFAQEQLALAAGQEVSGSMALGALGKMHAALSGKPNPEIVLPEAKAVVFFQAAMLACPKNYMAANDLGVLLAHNGDFAGARRALEHSVLVCRTSENLNNLSVVYRQIGDQRLTALAAQDAQAAKAAEIARQKSASRSAGGAVEWVDPSALAQSSGQWTDPPSRPAAMVGQQASPMTR